MDTEAKSYEIAYLINPMIPEDQVFSEAGKITGFVQDAHGVVGRIEEPKRQKIAYPINKSWEAYFGWTTFTVAPAQIGEIEKRLQLEKNIIRYLVVEEIKRPLRQPRAPRPYRAPASSPTGPVAGFTPQAPKEEDKTKIEELDKKLEEIFGQ